MLWTPIIKRFLLTVVSSKKHLAIFHINWAAFGKHKTDS